MLSNVFLCDFPCFDTHLPLTPNCEWWKYISTFKLFEINRNRAQFQCEMCKSNKLPWWKMETPKFLSQFLYPNLPRPLWGRIFNFHKIYFPSHSHLSPIHYIASNSPSSFWRSDQEEHKSVLTFFNWPTSLWWQCYVEIGPWILMMMMLMMMMMRMMALMMEWLVDCHNIKARVVTDVQGRPISI